MSEESQFRTVLRGFDPEQVKSAMDEMHTSVVTARRLAADRTIELTRMQDHLNQVPAAPRRGHPRADRGAGEAGHRQSAPSAGDVGARIGSILALANEEAEELRAAGRDQVQRHPGRGRRVGHGRAIRGRGRLRRPGATHRPRRCRPGWSTRLDSAPRRCWTRRTGTPHARPRGGAGHRRPATAPRPTPSPPSAARSPKHTDRLQQASTLVEQLAHEEATLVRRQGQESTERIERDTENQLAAVDARRQSITAQLSTVDELLQQLGRAVGPDAAGPDAAGPRRRRRIGRRRTSRPWRRPRPR